MTPEQHPPPARPVHRRAHSVQSDCDGVCRLETSERAPQALQILLIGIRVPLPSASGKAHRRLPAPKQKASAVGTIVAWPRFCLGEGSIEDVLSHMHGQVPVLQSAADQQSQQLGHTACSARGRTLCSSPGWPSTAGRPTTAAGTCCRRHLRLRRRSRCSAHVTDLVAHSTPHPSHGPQTSGDAWCPSHTKPDARIPHKRRPAHRLLLLLQRYRHCIAARTPWTHCISRPSRDAQAIPPAEDAGGAPVDQLIRRIHGVVCRGGVVVRRRRVQPQGEGLHYEAFLLDLRRVNAHQSACSRQLGYGCVTRGLQHLLQHMPMVTLRACPLCNDVNWAPS